MPKITIVFVSITTKAHGNWVTYVANAIFLSGMIALKAWLA